MGSPGQQSHLRLAADGGIAFRGIEAGKMFSACGAAEADYAPRPDCGGLPLANEMSEGARDALLRGAESENRFVHAGCLTVTGRTIAENLRYISTYPEQDHLGPTVPGRVRAAHGGPEEWRQQGIRPGERTSRQTHRRQAGSAAQPIAAAQIDPPLRRAASRRRTGDNQDGHPQAGAVDTVNYAHL
jgi:hypothetical protein